MEEVKEHSRLICGGKHCRRKKCVGCELFKQTVKDLGF